MPSIKELKALEILDSRGNPTIQVTVALKDVAPWRVEYLL
jgi:enolase